MTDRTNGSLVHVVKIDFDANAGDVVRWARANIQHGFDRFIEPHDDDSLGLFGSWVWTFESLTDAIHFKLRWAGT